MRGRSAVTGAFFICVLAMGFTGCAGKGEVVNLDIRTLPSEDTGVESVGQADRLTIKIMPFEDLRPNKETLGMRTHLGGGTTIFKVGGGPPAEVAAKVIAEYLTQRGWNATVGADTAQADVIMTGRLTEFSVRAKSRFFSTLLNTSLKLALRAENTADGSATAMSLEDGREDTVFWFEPTDLETLANEMLQESVKNMLASVQVKNGILRMK